MVFELLVLGIERKARDAECEREKRKDPGNAALPDV